MQYDRTIKGRARARQFCKQTVCVAAVAAMLSPGAAWADFDIGAGSTYKASAIGGNTPAFKGGTLQMDSDGAIANGFTVQDYSTNTMDANGHTVTFSGAFTGAGPLTFTDSVGGGAIALSSSSNAYTGATAVNSGAKLLLSGTGTLASSSSLTANGTFDISRTDSGASIVSLAGSGTVQLGTQTLALSAASGSFSGAIAGTGGLTLTSGTQILSGANTYTGTTTVTAGTLTLGAGGASGSLAGGIANSGILQFNRSDAFTFSNIVSGTGALTQAGSGTIIIDGVNTYTGVTTISTGALALSANGSIAASSGVGVGGVFDISATGGASVKSLSGAGTVQLGAQTLTLTQANGTFTGNITGSGGLTVNGGTQLLAGVNSYTGPTVVNGGMLQIGTSTYSTNVTVNNSGALGFAGSGAIAMTGIVSGNGGLAQVGGGTTTISTVQAYTGVTTISAGTLAIAGGGGIASSSSVMNNGTFSIAAAAGSAAITSLSGNGAVQLGSQTLVITNGSGNFTGTITGTGGLTVAGGNQTLSGINNYTGVTAITSGTLFLAGTSSLANSGSIVNNSVLDISLVSDISGATSSSIVSLGGSGQVNLGAKTLILTSAGDTFSGRIAGSGSLTLNGGTQTLSGQNTYSGATTISGGTLALAGAGSLLSSGRVVDNGTFDISAISGSSVGIGSLSGSGSVNLGAHSLNLTGAADTFSGTILGSGSLAVSGGTQILSGANTYTGGTTIAAGTLQIGRGTASGSIAGDVLNNGTLAFYRNGSYLFPGVISGSGGISQLGDGTTILTGNNVYTGGTVITAGTLQVGNGGASGAITGDVTDNATLAFARSDTTIFGGTISGAGGVSQLSGTTILTAANSYGGATVIASGATLAIAGGGGIASSSGVTANGVFDVSAASAPRITSLSGTGSVNLGAQSLTLTGGTGSFSGVIAGTGGLVVTGGTQTQAGVNTYTGATTINGGTLSVTGSIAASSGVTVNAGGTLAGSGTVSSVSLANGGTLAPGVAGAGTLKVNGSVAFSNAGNLTINTTSTSAGSLAVTGAENLAGTLTVVSADGTYLLGRKLTVLTADGGVSGTFTLAPLQNGSAAQFASTLSYDANHVYLQINLAKLSPLLPATGITRNQAAPIAGIDAAIVAGNTVPAALQNLGNVSSAALAADATQLAGEPGANLSHAGDALFDPFMNAMFDHMRDTKGGPAKPRDAWITGFTGTGILSGDADTGAAKIRGNTSGFAAGADWMLSSRFSLGFAVSSGSSSFRLADGRGTGHATALQAGAYGFIRFSPRIYGAFAAVLAQDDIKTDRALTVSGTDVLTAKPSAGMYGARYETGLNLDWLTPYFAVQDRLFRTDAYAETAASGSSSFALSYASQSQNMANVEFGVRQRDDVALNRNWTLRLSDQLAWSHRFTNRQDVRTAFTALPDSDFTVSGAPDGRDTALVSLGASLHNRLGFDLGLQLHSAVSSHSQNYSGLFGLNMRW